jgi:ATP-dependent exoDNAse (exonuclease V) beta subunit
MSDILKIYKSSAGSGKTFTLVKEYLKLCLPQPERFRNIVALTFTNAAATEMKERILDKLKEMSEGNGGDMAGILLQEGISPQHLRNADKLLEKILYNYAYFNVGTIDSFFHKILRAFNKELELPIDFDIFLETDEALDYAVDNFLHSSHSNSQAHKILLEFIREKIGSGSAWNIRSDLYRIAQELVKDNTFLEESAGLEAIPDFIRQLKEIVYSFERQMDELGRKAVQGMEESGAALEHFKYGKSGPAFHFYKLQRNIRNYEPGARFITGLESLDEWIKKNDSQYRLLEEVVQLYFIPIGLEVMALYGEQYPAYLSAKEVLKSIYTFAVYGEINGFLQEYRRKFNVVLISDFTKILSRHLGKEDISFVYSKAGARFEHFLIDEFQDTSRLQWNSLKPLVENAVSQGMSCLVVGDAKQAIYRWRGGEVELIEKQIGEEDFPAYSCRFTLAGNYRSRTAIVDFNNEFFKAVSSFFSGDLYENTLLEQIFTDVQQNTAVKDGQGGFVQLDFLLKEGRLKEGFCGKARDKMLASIHKCLKDGYSLKDIAILVRDKKEASEIAGFLFSEQLACITQDSLYLDHSPAVRLLMSALHYLNEPSNELARTQILFLYLRYFRPDAFPAEVAFNDIFNDFADPERGLYLKAMPERFTEHIYELSTLSIYELVETLAGIFGLNKEPDAYLQRFQDAVLEYSLTKSFGVQGFLDWWKNEKFTIVLPEDQDAIQIMTIHKSKGLEFPVVMIPYANWEFSSGRPNILWVEPQEAPFNTFNHLPVLSSSALKESLFADDFYREETLTAIDNLNLLYVAFTRARERLYACTQALEKPVEGQIRNISQLIHAVLQPGSLQTDHVMTYGEEIPHIRNKAVTHDNNFLQMQEYPITDWRETLLQTAAPDNYERLRNMLSDQTILERIRAVPDLFSAPDPLLQWLEKLFHKYRLEVFYGQKNLTAATATILLPGSGSYSPLRYAEEEGTIYLLDIAPQNGHQKAAEALRMFAAYLERSGGKKVIARLIEYGADEVIDLS